VGGHDKIKSPRSISSSRALGGVGEFQPAANANTFSKHDPRQRAELAGGLAFGFAGSLTRPNLRTPVGSFAGRSATGFRGGGGKAEVERRRAKISTGVVFGPRGVWDGLARRSPARGNGNPAQVPSGRGFESGDSKGHALWRGFGAAEAPIIKTRLGISKAVSGMERRETAPVGVKPGGRI